MVKQNREIDPKQRASSRTRFSSARSGERNVIRDPVWFFVIDRKNKLDPASSHAAKASRFVRDDAF
jgi:hypothetical protein